jgi:hypothetical protein
VATALDGLLRTALDTPGILEEYGSPDVDVFYVIADGGRPRRSAGNWCSIMNFWHEDFTDEQRIRWIFATFPAGVRCEACRWQAECRIGRDPARKRDTPVDCIDFTPLQAGAGES